MTPAETEVAIRVRVLDLQILAYDTALAQLRLSHPARREQFALALGGHAFTRRTKCTGQIGEFPIFGRQVG
jgi:hypothetical protein